jgi:hypothetical protein
MRDAPYFAPGRIGQLEVRNRLIRAATETMATAEGEVTDALIGLYTNLAKGGAGLLITGHMYVRATGPMPSAANWRLFGPFDPGPEAFQDFKKALPVAFLRKLDAFFGDLAEVVVDDGAGHQLRAITGTARATRITTERQLTSRQRRTICRLDQGVGETARFKGRRREPT